MTSSELTSFILTQSRSLPYANRLRLWRNNTGRRGCVSFGEKGSPDIIGFNKLTGAFHGIELKRKTEKQSTEQREFQEQLNATQYGGYWLVRDAESARQALDHIAGIDSIPW